MKTMFATLLHRRLRTCGMLAVCAVAPWALAAAQSPAARIAAEVNGSEMAVIKGTLHPMANPQYEAGRMPVSTQVSGITIMFNRSPAQEADLDALLAAQQNPASPQYHQWLTSDQFAQRFGMAQEDLDKVSAWLEQQGFAVESVNRSHNAIRFSGTVGKVESAFQTEMHYYKAGGETHHAPSTALSVPAAIAPVVANIRNLDDYLPRPNHIVPRPGFTSGVSGSVFLQPGDIATAYDIKPLYNAGVNGAGQTIAIIGESAVHLSDIENFQRAAGLTVKDPLLVIVPGTGGDGTFNSGDESESDLDLEYSSSIAPGANVVLVYTGGSPNTSGGVETSLQYAVDEMIGNIISFSYGYCEPAFDAASYAAFDAILKQAGSQGQSIVAASGDTGSTGCSGISGITTAQQTALAVEYPASSAYATGVGGTEMPASEATSSNTTYWSSNGSNDVVNSLLKYAPEVVWNDDASSANCTAAIASQGGCLSATGGGTSALAAQPSWQTAYFTATGHTNPSTSFRLVPDIAFYSSNTNAPYLLCTSDPQFLSSGQTTSCGSGFRASSTDTTLTAAGGTSFATPIFAGMVALLNQKLNYTNGQGLVNQTLYTLAANSATYTAAFHDITSGNNNCISGSNACGSTTGGFSAGTGYDEVTGLGSVDLNVLAGAWPANTGSAATLATTTTGVTASPTAANTGASVTFTISVSSSSTPGGNVTLQIDGGTPCGSGTGAITGCGGTTVSNQALSNGTLQYTTSFSTAGTHEVVAQYLGDSSHAASVGVGEVVISNPNSGKGTIAMSATNFTVARGSTGSSTITVTPSGGYTGTVDLTLSATSSGLANACYTFTTQTSTGGSVVVSGTAAATTQVSIDTNAADCTTAAVSKAKGLHAFKTASGRATRSDAPRPGTRSLPAGIALAGLLLAGFLARGSRKLRGLACLIALGALGLALTACGSSSTSTTTSDPPKGTYTINLTGTDSATSTITASASFTMTID